MDKKMMEIMVADWMADSSPEMDDLVLDGEPYLEEGTWTQDAHDEKADYTLTAHNGEITINYISAR